MAVGQVSFKDMKKTKRILVAARENPTVNRLNKTKVEKFPDLREEKEEVLRQARKKEQRAKQARREEEKKVQKQRDELKYQKDHAYDDIMSEENVLMSSNQDRDEDFLDDFM